MKTGLWGGVALATIVVAAVAFAQEPPSAQGDHPLIKPYPGSSLQKDSSEWRETNSWAFHVTNATTGETESKTVRGKFWRLDYVILAPDNKTKKKKDLPATQPVEPPAQSAESTAGGAEESTGQQTKQVDTAKEEPAEEDSPEPPKQQAVSPTTIADHFLKFAEANKAEIVYDDVEEGALTFVLINDDGNPVWCYIEAGTGEYGLWIVEERSQEKRPTFNAIQIKRTLDSAGHVPIYGVYFENEKASLRTQAFATLQEVVKLLRAYPTLALEIQCHTDNQGDAARNIELSKQRAETVRSLLICFGVDPARLTAQGCGDAKPIASNDTDEGRAQNRRIELVKPQQ